MMRAHKRNILREGEASKDASAEKSLAPACAVVAFVADIYRDTAIKVKNLKG